MNFSLIDKIFKERKSLFFGTGLPSSYFPLPTSRFQLRASHFQLPTSNSPLPTSDFQLPTSDSRTTKVCLIVPSLTMGGMERVMSELALHFHNNKNVQVHLILLAKREIFYSLPSNIHIYEPKASYKKLPWLLLALLTMVYIRKTVNRVKPAAVLSFCERYNSMVILATLLSGKKVFVSDRANPYVSQGKAVDMINPVVYRYAKGIVAQTSFSQEVILNRTQHANVTVIGNPIKPMKQVDESQKENIILNVGRFSIKKNQDFLLRYFAEIKDDSWKLVFAGDGERFEENKKLADELGITNNVVFAGKVQNVEELYGKAKIFAFTSTSEGFPNVLGEAMSAGLACISFDCEAGPSEMIVDEENGFLVPVGDHELYKERLSQLMQNPELRQKLGAEAGRITEKFNIKAIGDKFYDFMLG